MRSLKLPSRMQLITGATFWFIIGIGFQGAQVYQIAHHFNIIDLFISAAVLIVAIFFIYILQKFTSGFFNNPFTRIGLLIILIIKVILVEKFLGGKLVYDPQYPVIFRDTLFTRVFTAFLIISFFSFVFWLLFHLKKINDEDRLKQSAENSLRDAELMKLRQQIQPHFLFNSLNSINALVGSEPTQARKMIQNLSDFLRGTLKKDENKQVALKEEVELLKLYMDIEKVRFGHRLSINFDIDGGLMQKTLPPLILQPIVENAIKFGLYNVLHEVEIKITAQLKDNLLSVEVINPFDENTAITRKGEGFGLSTIQRRLQLIYHRADLLRMEKNNGTFKTIILIPQT